jgi:predicted PurR-regulated permease PerM
VTDTPLSLEDARMADAGTTSNKVAVTEGKGLAPPVTNSAIRAAIGFVIVIAVAAALWYSRTAIFLGFAGVLLAIVLYGASHAVANLTRMPRLVALFAVVVLVIGFLVLVVIGAGPKIAQQTSQLATSVAGSVTTLSKQVAIAADDRNLFQDIDVTKVLDQFSPWGIASGATSVAVSVFGAISAALIVLFFGIYFAVDPHTYIRLASRVAPEDRRDETRQMFYETGGLLRRWLIGQGISMSVIGGLTYVGLTILGVPIAFGLALFAGLAGFLPYLGPIIGAVPMVLVAAGESLDLALWVVGLYAIVQFTESYLLTPLIQARAVSLPPAVVILNQLVLGALFGILGLALATPLAAAAIVPLRSVFGADDEETPQP